MTDSSCIERKPKAIVIVNPASRSGLKVYRQLKKCVDKYFIHDVFFTKKREHASELANSSVGDVIIVCGGDGTVNEVANGLAGRTDIAVAPTYGGSGCDLSRVFGIAKKIDARIHEIYQRLMNGHDIRIKLSKVITERNHRYFVGVGDAGFGAKVAGIFDRYRRLGKIGYIIGVLQALFTIKPKVVKLTVDGETKIENVLMVMFARSKYYAGGMKVSPHSDPLSDRARMILLKWMHKLVFLILFPKVYSGTHVNVHYVEDRDATRIDIATPELPIDVEGEYVGVTPCTFLVTDEYIRIV
ncbi:MAG: diacylglycerol kinase family protein [Spirochaetes bacterium]|nr:diacylglycerol kinase family protein [Spirochaetota bacterium]